MFPHIATLADFAAHVESRQEIRIKTEDNGYTVICYMIQTGDLFTGPDAAWEQECRGITFRPNGTIAARTMNKFFNVGERPETQPENLPWTQVMRIMTKRDGSMVTPIIIDDVPTFKTKKSFGTPEAMLARQVCQATPGGVEFCIKMAELGLTPTFEITSPKFPIVIRYDQDELTLLHVRDNTTGTYLTEQQIRAFNPPFKLVENLIDEFCEVWDYTRDGISMPVRESVSWELLKNAAETKTGIEGWVIQFEDGSMVKLKTEWYQRLHKTIVFLRERDVAWIALEDKVDDLIGHFALVGKDPTAVRKINKTVLSDIVEIENSVRVEHQKLAGCTKKEAAIAMKGHPLFGLIMRAMDGKEIDVRGWYGKNILEVKFSLQVLDASEEGLEADSGL